MDLSIVVVNWNTRQLLRECLESVRANAPASFELIVVDNGSTDGSVEMVRSDFPEVVLIANEDNRGFAAANNQGFAIARGTNILLLNSDTVVHGDVLAESVRYLERNPEVGAMGCRVLNTDGTVQLTCSRFPGLVAQFMMASGLWKLKRPRFFGAYLMTDWQRDSEREVEVITGCYLLVRRVLIDQVGVLDEDFFFFGEETDWCLRMRKAGWKLMFAPVGTITHHGSASARKLNHKRDLLLTNALVRLQRKHYGTARAAASWLLACAFNGTRAVYWTLKAALAPSERSTQRAEHFRRVVSGLGSEAWPRRPGSRT